jgi:cation:H+ antiporter
VNDLWATTLSYLDPFIKVDALKRAGDLLFTPGWWQLLLIFTACSLVMIFRLNAMEKNGFEGTLIGTLVMPYFSGFPNLCFAWLILKTRGDGGVVLENCLVNNLTTLTIVLALPSLLWGLNLYIGRQRPGPQSKINHLSLLLSILALIFFCGAVVVTAKDGKISRSDGMLLVGIFLFWQLYHVFDVLKNNTRQSRKLKKRMILDFILISICAWGIFSSLENLIEWISAHGRGFFSPANLGLLSGILMVVPNAFLAVYYSAVERADIAYSSQIGDCHICIPLCIGLFAVGSPITVGPSLQMSLFIIMGASAGHFLFTAFMGRLPRFAGVILTGCYAFFIYKEIL